ncbi:PLDc N-terminal domain-containing protein [Microbacterium sp. NPDC057650]|uniref:PLDc N-terminal domain-containing protein n=1 Tax=unclassified Microbacterium TaxID=2609290 RepID=UPI00366A7F05
MGCDAKSEKKQISAGGKVLLTILGIVQIAFAALAFWDLAARDARQVRGPKPAWIPVILVNWIGPASYFAFGVKPDELSVKD